MQKQIEKKTFLKPRITTKCEITKGVSRFAISSNFDRGLIDSFRQLTKDILIMTIVSPIDFVFIWGSNRRWLH